MMTRSRILKGLPTVTWTDHGDDHYRLDLLRAVPGVVVTEPSRGVYLAVLANGIHIDFVGLESAGEDDSGIILSLLFNGNGIGGNLREMRHTYWGPDGDGYTFYLPLAGTIALLEALKVYFDD
jgi:hypothetical protein